MHITVRLFARHRELAGAGTLHLELAPGSCVGDVFATLAARYPGFRELEPWTTFARNRRVVGGDEVLADNDEVALLQPVSGGHE